LPPSNPNFNGTGDDAADSVVVDGAQVTIAKGECDGLRCGCGEVDALEPGEGADRRAVNAGMREIKLDDFVTGNGA